MKNIYWLTVFEDKDIVKRKINKQYANRVHLYPLVEIEDLVLPIIHGLLILSYDTCVGIAANEKVFKALPSLLVMKDAS